MCREDCTMYDNKQLSYYKYRQSFGRLNGRVRSFCFIKSTTRLIVAQCCLVYCVMSWYHLLLVAEQFSCWLSSPRYWWSVSVPPGQSPVGPLLAFLNIIHSTSITRGLHHLFVFWFSLRFFSPFSRSITQWIVLQTGLQGQLHCHGSNHDVIHVHGLNECCFCVKRLPVDVQLKHLCNFAPKLWLQFCGIK